MLFLITFLSVVTSIYAINRPVYKIVLTQKGYAQFLQYDLETPPLREFTFCTWIRIYEFTNDQTIFTYIARNNRIMRLWLDSGGSYLTLSINQRVTTSFPIEIVKDVWRHVCLSYQSEFGAWALYIDSRLAGCNSAQSLHGYVLPGGGSVIVGYGIANDGKSNGLEGEVFGTNMILISTIERNNTSKRTPDSEQKTFQRNKLKNSSDASRYIVLDYLQSKQINNNFENIRNTSEFRMTKKPVVSDANGFETSTVRNLSIIENNNFDFWKVLNQSDHNSNSLYVTYERPLVSSTRISPLLSEIETPPPRVSQSIYFGENFDTVETKTDTSNKFYKSIRKTTPKQTNSIDIVDYETPPPVDKDTKVYGQWTSSKYAGSVLNYLKSINFQSKEKSFMKTPATITLSKISDTHPYASELILSRLRPPSQFRRRNLVEKHYDSMKRDPQINVQIIENDLRSSILRMHSQTQPKKVEITNRGEPKKRQEQRFYRNADYDITEESNSVEDLYKPKAFPSFRENNKQYKQIDSTHNAYKNPKSVMPFLRSLEYTIDENQNESNTSEDIYLKSFSRGNKWHNVKSYSNDYTPRKINMDLENDRHPTIRLKYKYENQVFEKEDPSIMRARKLAMEVSNTSDQNKDSVSIYKYNHGYLPNHEKKKLKEQRMNSKRNLSHNNFDRQVKLGNVLNEHHLLGENEVQTKKSFVGGHEHIPDITIYKSKDIVKENAKVSHVDGTRVCKDLELYDRVLYVQPDESIDMSHIISPLRHKNIAIDFIMQNYKKCSLKESNFEVNPKLFIDWIKTPVRLFGGAFPRRTTDLCGFF